MNSGISGPSGPMKEGFRKRSTEVSRGELERGGRVCWMGVMGIGEEASEPIVSVISSSMSRSGVDARCHLRGIAIGRPIRRPVWRWSGPRVSGCGKKVEIVGHTLELCEFLGRLRQGRGVLLSILCLSIAVISHVVEGCSHFLHSKKCVIRVDGRTSCVVCVVGT